VWEKIHSMKGTQRHIVEEAVRAYKEVDLLTLEERLRRLENNMGER
jgi:hypothetical protein